MNENTETISVAIPTYNRADFIASTLDSILAQTHPVSEIIIIDDGSTDNTDDIVKPYLSLNIPIIFKKIENAGPAIARKKAIDLSNSKWVALCDSDDLWSTTHIEDFISCINLYPTINTYFSNFITSDAADTDKFTTAPEDYWRGLIAKQEKGLFLLNKNSYNYLLDFQPIFQSALLFTRSLYEEIGGISEDLGRINSEDAHLTRRLATYGVLGGSFTPNVTIVKHGDNYSSDTIKNLEGRLSILTRLCDQKEIPDDLIAETKQNIITSRLDLFNMYYWYKQYNNAVTIFPQVKKDNQFSLKVLVKYYICVFKNKFSN